jgi:sugar phosphate permease
VDPHRFDAFFASVNWTQVALILPGIAALVTALVVLHIAKSDRRAAARREHLKYQIEALAVIADHTSQEHSGRKLDGRLLAYIYVIGEKRLPLAYAWANVALTASPKSGPRVKPTRHQVAEEVSELMAEAAHDLKRVR